MIPSLSNNADPDDAFSSIPYEKGSTFLYFLEEVVGQPKWDKFIPHYFSTWKFKSLDSFEFKSTLLEFFASDPEASVALKKQVDWERWFYAPGLPPWKPEFDTSLVDVCYALAKKWETLRVDSKETSNFEPHPDDAKGWTANQIVVFLETLQLFPSPLHHQAVQSLGSVYSLDSSANVEIVSRFYQIGLIAGYKGVLKPTAELLGRVGRMKFVRPLYREMAKVDNALAKATFEKYRKFYHPICRNAVEGDLYGEKKN